MAFTKEYLELREIFDLKKDQILLPESDILIHNCNFQYSDQEKENQRKDDKENQNKSVNRENIDRKHPRYTVFKRRSDEPVSKAILLIHGLNEKKWDKYLCWAKYLLETTNKPVILFPITFQMYRTRREKGQLSKFEEVQNDSAFLGNSSRVAPGERKTNLPERFAITGFQSVCDILSIVAELKEGRHRLFNQNVSVDLFGYSIGAFIAQILLLANPKNLFDDSKFLFFCGGPFFNKINGGSRYAITNRAFKKMQQYYVDEVKWKNSLLQKYIDALGFENIGLAFKAMLSAEKFKRFREKVFREYSKKIHAVALVKDAIVSPDNVYKALRGDDGLIPVSINVLDYPYKYTHESPFPLFKDPSMNSTVDSCFNSTFTMVANFLRER